MPKIACPKCGQNYQLPDNLIGKPVKCQKCGAKFKVGGKAPAPAVAAGATVPQPPVGNSKEAQDLAQFGLDGPIQGGNAAIFGKAPAPPADGGFDPLGNLAIDPGFGNPNSEEEDSDRGALFDNPAIKKKKKKKEFHYEPQKTSLEDMREEPFSFKEAIKEVWFILLIVLGIVTVVGVLIPQVMGDHMSYISTYCLLTVSAAAVGVHIWGSILAYKNSEKNVATLCLCLLVPFFIFYYAFTNWSVMKPFIQAFAVCAILPLLYLPFMLMGGGDNFS